MPVQLLTGSSVLLASALQQCWPPLHSCNKLLPFSCRRHFWQTLSQLASREQQMPVVRMLVRMWKAACGLSACCCMSKARLCQNEELYSAFAGVCAFCSPHCTALCVRGCCSHGPAWPLEAIRATQPPGLSDAPMRPRSISVQDSPHVACPGACCLWAGSAASCSGDCACRCTTKWPVISRCQPCQRASAFAVPGHFAG